MACKSFFIVTMFWISLASAMDNSLPHCFVCDKTAPAELIRTNDFFNCDINPCAIYCKQCFLRALKRQTCNISFRSYCKDFKCPVCWGDIYRSKCNDLLLLLTEFRQKPQKIRFYNDDIFFTIYNDNNKKPLIGPQRLLLQNDQLLQAIFALKHADSPEGCKCCEALNLLRKSENGAIKAWQYLINKPIEIGLLLEHNPRLLGKIGRNYSPEQKRMLAVIGAAAVAEQKENLSETDVCVQQ